MYVPVVEGSTVRTGPRADSQRHFFLNRPTSRTRLAGRKPAVRHNHPTTTPFRLIFQLPPELEKTHVGIGSAISLPSASHRRRVVMETPNALAARRVESTVAPDAMHDAVRAHGAWMLA
jgi:hypothetical protein